MSQQKISIRLYNDREVRAIWDEGSEFHEPKELSTASKKQAYNLFDINLFADKDVGRIESLKQIHAYIFGGLYDFAGKIRQKNISKGGFQFAMSQYLDSTLQDISNMPDSDFEEIMDKYIEMNVAHPFMEGNGRSTRIWLDMLLKARLGLCIDWSKVDKNAYLDAMVLSPVNGTSIKSLLRNALTDDVHSREIFMKGIDYSYYYEED